MFPRLDEILELGRELLRELHELHIAVERLTGELREKV